MKNFALVVLAIMMAVPAIAEFNNLYPRTRFFSEIGRPKETTGENSTRRRRTISQSNKSVNLADDDHYSVEKARFGAFFHLSTDWIYRDFLISDSGSVGMVSAYASFYGVEASVLAVNDFGDELETSQPMMLTYRLSYTFKYQTSINTVSVSHQDWSESASKIGTKGQGFGDNAPIFEEEATEVGLSSYWFTEKIQPNQMNLFVGFDAQIWIEEPGFRTVATAGAFANKYTEGFLPNGARIQGSMIFQSDYHTDGASTPAVEAHLEAYWDFRYGTETTVPLIITLFGDYYLPLDEDPLDKIAFGGRIEFAF